jgi:hypothetical protein
MTTRSYISLGAGFGSRLLSSFLPPKDRESITRSRSLISVGSVLAATVFEIINVLSFVLVPPTEVILWSNFTLLIVSFLSLLSFRKGVEPGKVVPFFVSSYIFVVAIVSSKCQGFMAPGMYYFPIFLMYGALLSRSRWTIIQSVAAIVATLYVFTQTTPYGLSIPYGWDFVNYFKRMNSVAVILCFVGFCCMAVQDYYRKRTHDELRLENEWMFRSSRLFEISTISGGLHSQLTNPVLTLGADIKSLLALSTGTEGRARTLEQLDQISHSIDNLTRVSRSINLMQGASSRKLHAISGMSKLNEHLSVILAEKAKHQGWDLLLDSYDPALEIEGKIASLALLISTLALRVFEDFSGGEESKLSIRAIFAPDPEDKRIQWILSFPKVKLRAQNLVPDLVRKDMSYLNEEQHEKFVQGLLADCGGEIRRVQGPGMRHEIFLRGDWFWV